MGHEGVWRTEKAARVGRNCLATTGAPCSRSIRGVLRRALPALFVLVLGLGLAAGSGARAQGPLTPRAFLPMVASGGELPTTPLPATGAVTVRGLSSSSVAANGSAGELRAYGEVVNGTSSAIGAVVVEVTARRASGAVVGRERATSRLEAVAPGDASPFGVLFEGVVAPGAVTVTAEVVSVALPAIAVRTDLAVTVQPPVNVILSEDGTTAVSATQLAVNGVVRNAGGARLEMVQAAIAIYDASGNVVFAGFTNTFSMPFLAEDAPPVLGPGQSGSFQVLVPRGPIMAAGAGLVVKAWAEAAPAR